MKRLSDKRQKLKTKISNYESQNFKKRVKKSGDENICEVKKEKVEGKEKEIHLKGINVIV